MATHGRAASLIITHRQERKVRNTRSVNQGGREECEDGGNDITHGIDELLYSVCHRTKGLHVHHLGKKRRLLAT